MLYTGDKINLVTAHTADHMAKKIDVKQINQSVMSASIEKNRF